MGNTEILKWREGKGGREKGGGERREGKGGRGKGGGERGEGKRYKNSLFPTLTTSEEKLGLRLAMKHKEGVEQNEGGAGRERAQGRWRDPCRSVEWPLL